MQTVALKPKRAEWTAMAAGLVLLCVLMCVFPAASVVLALGIPLLGCPLVGRREEPVAWAACAVPAAASLVGGVHPLYALSLALIGLGPMVITKRIPLPKRPGTKGILMYVAAETVALTFALAAAGYALGGALWVTLPQMAAEKIGQMKNPAPLLHQLAGMGLLSLPEGYTSDSVIRPLMQAGYNRQMLMSLRLTLEMLLELLLPGLVVQACVIVGLFTALRLERVNGVVLVVEAKTASEKQTRIIAPPSFRLLTMPPNLRWLALGLFLGSLMLILSMQPVVQIMGRLAYALAETLYQLQGAAIVVFWLTKNDPDRRTLAGVLAAALYVLMPQILLMVGILDHSFHFRHPQAHKPD